MEKRIASSLFVNDGSFMERFKQLQQENEKGASSKESKPGPTISGTPTPKPIISKISLESKANDSRKTTPVASSGKLTFSLKQKSKLVAPPVKLDEDEDEDGEDAGNVPGNGQTKRQRLDQSIVAGQSSKQIDVGNYFLISYINFYFSG
uniref:Putative G-patch domain-containing protein n=1 Tax=Davidia involucrata TaxID=16924 RepID=A0A5B6YPT6_DAVIN